MRKIVPAVAKPNQGNLPEIPKDWLLFNLTDLVSCVKGKKPRTLVQSSPSSNEYLPYLTTQYMREGKAECFVSMSSENGVVAVAQGDTMLIWDGSNAGEVFKGRNGVLASTMVRVHPSDKIDPDFLYFFLKTRFSHLNGQTTGSTIPHVSKTAFNNIVIPLPRMSEQCAIAAFLNKLDLRMRIQEQQCAKLNELKAATMAKLFREGLRGEPLKQTEIGEIPADWTVTRLGYVCDLKSGGTPDRTNLKYWGGGIPWVKTAEVNYRIIDKTTESISELGLKESSAKVFPKGTVIMAMYGQGVTRGRVGILGIDAATNQACAALFPHRELNSRFLYHWLAHNYERIRDFGHGANQKNLSLTLLEGITLPVPSNLTEQIKIADLLDSISERLKCCHGTLDTRRALFQSTLHCLMTGQVRLNDLAGPQ